MTLNEQSSLFGKTTTCCKTRFLLHISNSKSIVQQPRRSTKSCQFRVLKFAIHQKNGGIMKRFRFKKCLQLLTLSTFLASTIHPAVSAPKKIKPTSSAQKKAGAAITAPAPLTDWPRLASPIKLDAEIERRIDALIASMSLEEKVGQITQVETQQVTPDEIKKFHIGSVLNGGDTFPGGNKQASVQDWLNLADEFWEASMDKSKPHQIPVMWGTDAVHGHNNVKGATIFPHNIGLGAARDPELLKRIGEVTAREVARTGIDWVFAPTVAAPRDDRWGRSYEGYSESPEIIAAYSGKIIEGLQGQLAKDANAKEKVVATAKHFIGDGGTLGGEDRGVTYATEQELINLHGHGYFTGIRAGVQAIMASFNSWKDKAKGENAKAYKMHGNKYLLTDVLKTKMGFDGFVIGDWNALGQVSTSNSDSPRDCTDSDCPQAINAGVDMAMVPERKDWQLFIPNTIASVQNNEISESRINDAVRRVLRVKFRAGLFAKPKPSLRVASREIGTAEDRAVAREAVRKSLVLLKNNGGVLPLSPSKKILVTGKSADSLPNQCGGWSRSWQGKDNTNEDIPGGTSIWQAIKKVAPNAVLDAKNDGVLADESYDVAIVVIGETPYAEYEGDIKKDMTLEHAKRYPEDLELINKLKEKGVKKIVTLMVSGRPLYANKEINRSDAFVAAWLPGSEGDGVADVLLRKKDDSINYDFTGKLSYTWPRSACQTPINMGDSNYNPLYAYGYGLTYQTAKDQGPSEETTQNTGCE
jgi:beta-glucosidase